MPDRFPFLYFAREYGLSYVSAFSGCSEESQPSVQAVAALIDAVEQDGVPVVYVIEMSTGDVARAVSEQTGAEIVEMHSCQSVTGEEFEAGGDLPFPDGAQRRGAQKGAVLMRGEYQTRQKREMTRFLAEHAMQGFTPEELARAMEAEGVRVGLTTAYRFLESLCRQQTARRYQDARGPDQIPVPRRRR